MIRRRYRVVVEGCVDAALASSIMKRALRSRDNVSTDIQGGWHNVVRASVSYLISGAEVGIVAFVDADFSANERIKEIKNVITSITKSRTQIEVLGEANNCFMIEIGNNQRLGLMLWANSEGKGTIEDVLREALEEKYGCGPFHSNVRSCSGCPSGHKLSAKYEKLEVLCVLASCGGVGTLVLSEETGYCGLNLNRLLSRLDLLSTRRLESYVSCAKRIIDVLKQYISNY